MPNIQVLNNRGTIRHISIVAILLLTCFGLLHVFFSATRGLPHFQYDDHTPLQHPNPHFKAAFVTYTKTDVDSVLKLRSTIRDIQDRFNHHRGYPYIIFSNEVMTDEFKELVSSTTQNNVRFEHLDASWYGYPSSIDKSKAAKAREDMKHIIFGASDDYRFQARFMAGLIFRHPAMKDLDYYWRFEIGTKYLTPIDFDPFQYMKDNGKKLSFSFALYEYHDTIPSLFPAVDHYVKEYPAHTIHKSEPDTLWPFIIDANSNEYNNCHFWSNFQIADLSFFKGPSYQHFFNYIDQLGGIFYERWGDPVIHTMGATVLLRKSQIHYWETIGYQVADQFTHCPLDRSIYKSGVCRPVSNFDNQGYSCLPRFLQ
ncbi:unnamed protein product [Absidia cylindrospora]